MEYTKASMGDVVKLEKKGDSLEGEFVSVEESRQFKDSYAVRVKNAKGLQTVFVSRMVKDLLDANQVIAGKNIKIEFTGKQMNEQKTREYNTYELYLGK